MAAEREPERWVAPPVPASSPVVSPLAVPDLSARRGVLFMLGSALGFSLMGLFVKLASAELPSMEIVFARSVFMTVVTGTTLRVAGQSLWGTDRPTLVARGVVGATALSLFYVGIARLPLGDAVTIQYTAPVWTALTAALLIGERLRPLVLVGAALSLAGVVLVAQPSVLFGDALDPLDGWGVAAVATAAVLSGLAYTFVRKLRATDNAMTIIFYLSWIGTVGALPFALGGWTWPTPTGWLLLLAVGAATHVGQVCLTKGMHLLEAATASSIGYVQVVLAFAWGVLFLGDAVDGVSLAGAALVVSSVLLIVRRARRVPAEG